VLFASAEDVVTLENFAYGDTPTPEAIASLLADVLERSRDFDVSIDELARAHDIRHLVVKTILTYLELEGVLEATGPFYQEYKFQPQRPIEAILRCSDTKRAAFLSLLFSQARKGRIWWLIDVAKTVQALGEPRERIVKALTDLEEQGELVLEVNGARQGYRLLQAEPDLHRLGTLLAERFQEREAREVARVRSMLAFAQAKGCQTRRLLAHFGEALESDCGHCGHCLGVAPRSVPAPVVRPLGRTEQKLVAQLQSEGHAALAAPRQLARFLCGLTSPATSRAGLKRDQRFGALAEVPFLEVLNLVQACGHRHIMPAA
jgi:ATP-dependent DNA helicase RecQ